MLSLDAFSRGQMRLAVGLHPDPLGELKRSPRLPTTIRGRGPTSKGKGREGKGRKGGDVRGKGNGE